MLREVLYFEDVVYRIESLMVYNNIQNDEVMIALKEVSRIIAYDDKLTGINRQYYDFATKLVAKAEELGLSGHLLKQYSIYLFLKDRNYLSQACENGIDVSKSTLYGMAIKDMGVLQYFMDFDLKNLCENVGYGEKIYEYTPTSPKEYPELDDLGNCQKAEDLLTKFIWQYSKLGCGRLSDNYMFRLNESGLPIAVKNHDKLSINNIYGYRAQKDKIKANTEAFLKGRPAHSLLLTGRSGIGKFSLIKSIADRYFDKGLIIFEIGRRDFKYIDNLLEMLSTRGKKFIVAIDELSYENIQQYYDDLKLLLGFSLELIPKNVLLYASSSCDGHNPITEYFRNVIEFPELSEFEFIELVAEIARDLKLSIPEGFLKEQAKAWIAGKEEKSGKTAKQFVNSIILELGKE